MERKILCISYNGKQIIHNKHMVIDYCGDVASVQATCIYLQPNGSLMSEAVTLNVVGHQKKKTVNMKVDKKRRDSTRKGYNAYFSVVSLAGGSNGN
jgi:hypothetical protein